VDFFAVDFFAVFFFAPAFFAFARVAMVRERITQVPWPCRLKQDGGAPLRAAPRRSTLTSAR
jgi:hypothetical protein